MTRSMAASEHRNGILGTDMPIGTLLSVFRQAQLEREKRNG